MELSKATIANMTLEELLRFDPRAKDFDPDWQVVPVFMLPHYTDEEQNQALQEATQLIAQLPLEHPGRCKWLRFYEKPVERSSAVRRTYAMHKTKFSAGKWEIDVDSWADHSWSINIGDHYAAATVVTEASELSGRSTAELEANAHLIVSSPKLYNKLVEVEEFLACLIGEYAYDSDLHADIIGLLAEARGEQS